MMTDNEIIKEWEFCILPVHCNARQYYFDKVECSMELKKNTLDLINRQKAEIVELQHKIVSCNAEIEGLKEPKMVRVVMSRGNEKSLTPYRLMYNEGVKEFAERLKEKAEYYSDLPFKTVDVEEIDNLVKEMVGDNE